MAIPPVIYALAKKRAQLVAELSHPQGRHDHCQTCIEAIDLVMPLWEAGKNPPVYKRQHKARPALVPNLSRKIIGTLRDVQPASTREIVDVICAGMELSRENRARLNVTAAHRLKEMRRDGRVRSEKRDGRVWWELVPLE